MNTKEIVEVQFLGEDGQPHGRRYSYYTEIHLDVGDKVILPTKNGENVGVVCAVNVPEIRVDERILPLLKTISQKAVAA